MERYGVFALKFSDLKLWLYLLTKNVLNLFVYLGRPFDINFVLFFVVILIILADRLLFPCLLFKNLLLHS